MLNPLRHSKLIFGAALALVSLSLFPALLPAAEEQNHTAGGVSFSVDPAWQQTPVISAMRQAQFRIPKTSSDAEDSELAVFYFGPGQGGDIQANIDRWAGQFETAEGTAPGVEKRNVNGLDITVVSIKGKFLGGMTGQSQEPKPGFALLGAIAEGPQGPVFFKMTGPEATLENARPQFDAFVQSFKA